MKKFLLLSLTVLLGVTCSQAQLRFGASAGIPVGDAANAATFAVIADLGYFFYLSDKVAAGPITGLSFSFGDGGGDVDTRVGLENFVEEEGENVLFVPIGGGVRWYAAERLTLGADLGYAIGINSGNGGGLYHAPTVAYAMGELVDLVLAYRGILAIEEEGYWETLSLGVVLNIK